MQYGVKARGLPSRPQLRRWARAALESDACITVRFVGRGEGRALNRAFRGSDHATNVLTFVMHGSPPLQGDLALCVPIVACEARAQGRSVSAHYAHLVVHGVLHLQGYDHEALRAARLMERRESEIITRLGYADPHERQGQRQKARGK